MKLILPVLLVAGAAAAAASAQSPADRQQRQVRHVVVYGNDRCPTGSADEIVVCARRPETERYRVPGTSPGRSDDPGSESWAERARSLDEPARAMQGPGACEPVGPGHHVGCLQEMIDSSRAARDAEQAQEPQL